MRTPYRSIKGDNSSGRGLDLEFVEKETKAIGGSTWTSTARDYDCFVIIRIRENAFGFQSYAVSMNGASDTRNGLMFVSAGQTFGIRLTGSDVASAFDIYYYKINLPS